VGLGADRLTVSGNDHSQIFNDDGDHSMIVTLSGLTLANGAGSFGGAIFINFSTWTIMDALFRDNAASSGGGIFNFLGTLTVQNSTFRDNQVSNSGGGIFNFGSGSNNGTATVRDSTFSGNSSQFGGGLFNTGIATVENSTFSNNTANTGGGLRSSDGSVTTVRQSTFSGNSAFSGGGIYHNGVSFLVQNSTITLNLATSAGGGLFVNPSSSDGSATVESTIIARNNAQEGLEDVYRIRGTLHVRHSLIERPVFGGINGDNQANLFGVDPLLGPLADNGGPTLTHALLPGSPASDAGSNPAGLATDQRGDGFPRTRGSGTDIGAVEGLFSILTLTLPDGTYGTTYQQTITTGNSVTPVSFTVNAGALPGGLTLDTATGQLSGTPTAAGTFGFTVLATDATGATDNRAYTLIINPRTLTVSATAANKVYDGTTAANVTLSDNRVTGDNLTITFTSATFDTKNVGTNKTVIVNSLALSGADANNYTLAATTATTTADITPATLTVRADDQSKPFGQPNPALTFTVTGFVAGEDMNSGDVQGHPELTTAATEASLPGKYVIEATTGTLTAGNYAFVFEDGTLTVTSLNLYAVGADAGGGPHVKVYHADGSLRFSFLAFAPSFTGGVRVAVGDVNGDGIDDIIVGAGSGGGPHVKVFSGVDLTVLASFFAFSPSFTGGVFVAAGNLDGDGAMEVIVGAGAGGGPHVRSFKIDSGVATQLPGPLGSFFAYAPSFTGGVHVAAGNFDGTGTDEIITGPGAGGGPHVKAFRADGAVIANLFAYAPSFTGGVWVAAGDLNDNGMAEIITGAGAGGGPHVKVFHGGDLALRHSFFAYDADFRGGVRVGTVHLQAGGTALITGPGPVPHLPDFNRLASGGNTLVPMGTVVGPLVRLLDGLTLAQLDSFFAYDPNFHGGLFVGG
ncbi:MAG: choice-of-anchor Q domain-containing protein, partial [Gemmataceae bacterium]